MLKFAQQKAKFPSVNDRRSLKHILAYNRMAITKNTYFRTSAPWKINCSFKLLHRLCNGRSLHTI